MNRLFPSDVPYCPFFLTALIVTLSKSIEKPAHPADLRRHKPEKKRVRSRPPTNPLNIRFGPHIKGN